MIEKKISYYTLKNYIDATKKNPTLLNSDDSLGAESYENTDTETRAAYMIDCYISSCRNKGIEPIAKAVLYFLAGCDTVERIRDIIPEHLLNLIEFNDDINSRFQKYFYKIVPVALRNMKKRGILR